MELSLQPKPEVEIPPAHKGIVSKKDFFVKKVFEQINQYFFAGHLIRSWKPKAELIYPSVSDESAIQYECDFNRDIQNCFVEDYAEEVFLRTPPPCFVVLGKFGTNVRKLSEDIANEYGSVLIEVDNIVNQVIKTESETAKFLDRVLRLGVSLTLNFILALLSYVAHSPEARHRGYVLCGLPCLPHMYDLSVEQQLNYLFTWENKPTVFINVLFEDDDLIKARSNLRYEIEGEGKNKVISIRCQLDESGDDEGEEAEDEEYKDLLYVNEEEEEEEDVQYERDLNISPSQPCIKLPRDGEDQVWSELELFDILIKPFVDLTTSRVDPQFFMTVDSRVKNTFEMVQARLFLLRIWKVPVAVPFMALKRKEITEEEEEEAKEETEQIEKLNEPPEEEEITEDPDILQVADEPPQTAFLTLFAKKTISPKFRWELSHYNYICPVSLREGQVIEGKSKFAVIFMKYIYFLRDEESMIKFIRNPRAYVLPIRPKPPCRFFIIGYPYCGKTLLAHYLASEYSITFIDLKDVLKEDATRKKNIYKQFCRQKAEAREIIRLTAQSWRDWRLEEEQRISLIEKWISYIQTLLAARIEQFYSLTVKDDAFKDTHVPSYSSAESMHDFVLGEYGESSETDEEKTKKKEKLNMQVCGVPFHKSDGDFPQREYSVDSTAEKIKRAMKNEDYSFDETGLEIEANLFFLSLWNTFSHGQNSRVEGQERGSEDAEENTDNAFLGDKLEESDTSINWASLLPPQSLSSLMLKTKTYTRRERRNSFRILLAAASKARWSLSGLRAEFAKWRVPGFMDIPLCEILLENPLLLYKYCPEWLKERPFIPDPIDPNHPSVVEAGRKSFNRADCVTIKQDKEEVGILLRDAIEKAEKDGMRITGEVISPGGWVVDNMVLDLDIWSYLAQESIFADHVYILTDTEPELKRIVNMWCEWNCPSALPGNAFSAEDYSESVSIEINSHSPSEELPASDKNSISDTKGKSATGPNFWQETLSLILENLHLEKSYDLELDKIFEIIKKSEKTTRNYSLPFAIDVFCQNFLLNIATSYDSTRQNSLNDEFTISIHSYDNSSSSFCLGRGDRDSSSHFPLGIQLQILTDEVINYLNEMKETTDEGEPATKMREQDLTFFISLLTLPKKLEEIKNHLDLAKRSYTVKEIVVTDRTTEDIFLEIVENLNKHFIKKPRELESFEVDEINKEFQMEMMTDEKKFENEGENELETENDDEEKTEGREERDDIRIYGESGPFCIVNLERNILLKGKPEFVLRYYGKLYFFWNEIAKEKFIEDPEKYSPYYSPIRCLPPVRIFVVGAMGCGKTSIARSISLQCGLPQVEYIRLLGERLVPHMSSKIDRNAILNEKKILLSDRHNDAAITAKKQFLNAPFESRQHWLENHIHTLWNEGKLSIKHSLTALKQPAITTNFPELKYKTLEQDIVEPERDDQDSQVKSERDTSEPPFTSMDQIGAKLYQYVQNKSDLEKDFFLKCINVLWNQEPYIRHGFVLERFPLRSSDVEKITENNFIPDLILEVSLPEHEMIVRNIDYLLEAWKSKLDAEIMEEKVLEETIQGLKEILTSLRRSELVTQKQDSLLRNESKKLAESSLESTRKKENEKNVGMSDPLLQLDEQSQKEIQDTLEREFPTLGFNPVYESYESGRERIEADLSNNYRRDLEEIDKIKQIFGNISVPWLVIDNRKDLSKNLNEIFLKLNQLKKRVNQRGEFAFVMKMETAEKLLQQGYYFLSKFGRWCPIQVFRMKNPIHMFRPLQKKGKIFPVAYRNYIYFVAGENERSKFLNDPIKYTFNEPHHPNIPLRVAVIGPPKSGKSVLCKRLQSMFDLKVVTMGTALRFVMEQMADTSLKKSIDDYLKRGCFLPLSLKIEALMACLNDPTCASQGFIFDGIPFDAAMTQSLAEKGKLPFVILSLVGDAYSGKSNRESLCLTDFRLPYKQRVNLDTKYKEWDETYKRFSQWNQEMYNNLYELKAKSNAADIFYKAYDIIRKSFFAILYYVENCVSDKALPLEHMCISQNEYELRKSSFHNNCPVCWAESNTLNCSSDPPSRSGLVQYLNHFYWVCPSHMEKFLKKPKIYFPPNVPAWPVCLPKILNRRVFESASSRWEIHGMGRCPVTGIDLPTSLDWEGSWDYAASYIGRVYLCKNKEMLTRFLATPWKYCAADTEFETTPLEKSSAVKELGPPVVTSLPPIGFLEQTVASLIHKALKILGAVRPLYPNLTPACTGCTFVGLYLKAHNKNKDTSLEMEYLNYMMNECKASRFWVRAAYERKRNVDTSQVEPSENDFSDSSEDRSLQICQNSLEQEGSFTKTIPQTLHSRTQDVWGAKKLGDKSLEMILTSKGELQEIVSHPREYVILRFTPHNMRSNPLPPIKNCLNYLYVVRPILKLQKKFNYNTLLPPSPNFLYETFIFNPKKQFSFELYRQDKPRVDSVSDVKIQKRTISVPSLRENQSDVIRDPEKLLNIFLPRFGILDTFIPPKNLPPPLPTVVTQEPTAINPYRDYTYTLLMSDFFHCTHILRSYEWDEHLSDMEYGYLLDKSLKLCPVESVFFRRPHITASVTSRRSIDSYMDIFDAATNFKYRNDYKVEDECISERSSSSLVNYFEMIIMERLEEAVARVSENSLVHDSYDTFILPTETETEFKSRIVVHETLPYLPLIWDIISRPYHAYRMVCLVFSIFSPDNIAHEKYISFLDGINDSRTRFKFVQDPQLNIMAKEMEELALKSVCVKPELKKFKTGRANELRKPRKTHYFFYDYFHLPWTSFLTLPFFWAYGVVENFCGVSATSSSYEVLGNTST